jgi:hypothetical protein
MSETPSPGVPQTSTKAWVAALITLLTYVAARFGIGETPPIENVGTALQELGGAAVSFGVGWLLTWLTPNKPK